MKRFGYSFLLIYCISLFVLSAVLAESTSKEPFLLPQSGIPAWQDAGSDTVLLERSIYGDYVFESVGVFSHARFTISKAGEVLFTSEEFEDVYYYRAGHRSYARLYGDQEDGPLASALIPMGTDITGDGVPNLLVSSVMTGNAGVWIIDLFEIGEEFRHIQRISENYGDLFNRNGKGAMVYTGRDRGFAYLPVYTGGGRANIPYPTFFLSYQDEAYKLDADLMRKEAPSAVDLKKLADKIRNVWPGEGVQLGSAEHSAPIEFVSKVIGFVYEGNLDAARYLEKHAVPEHAQDGVTTVILPHIYEEIGASRYADALLRMNGVDSFWPRKK